MYSEVNYLVTAVQTITLAIILGTLLAIVYSLRILVLLERRIARMDHHIELMTMAVLKDERKVLEKETRIEQLLEKALVAKVVAAPKKASTKKRSSSKTATKATKKKTAKKATKKASKKTAKKAANKRAKK